MNPSTPTSFSRSGNPSDRLPSQGISTAQAMERAALYGAHPSDDEPEYREMPDADELQDIARNLMGAISGPLADTALEDDVPALLWSVVNLLNFQVARTERELDDNVVKQREAQEQQDGSEVRSVELERLITKGQKLEARRDAYEALRDRGAESYEGFTGSAWRPRTGSKVNHRALTAAMIDSRDFIKAKRYADIHVHVPQGPVVVFTGGSDYNNVDKIWAELDRIHARHPEMVLVHSAKSKGADRIAVCWANARKVTDVPFTLRKSGPNDTTAGWKRNDQMLETKPIGVVVFPGPGTVLHVARRAREQGIPVRDFTAE